MKGEWVRVVLEEGGHLMCLARCIKDCCFLGAQKFTPSFCTTLWVAIFATSLSSELLNHWVQTLSWKVLSLWECVSLPVLLIDVA